MNNNITNQISTPYQWNSYSVNSNNIFDDQLSKTDEFCDTQQSSLNNLNPYSHMPQESDPNAQDPFDSRPLIIDNKVLFQLKQFHPWEHDSFYPRQSMQYDLNLLPPIPLEMGLQNQNSYPIVNSHNSSSTTKTNKIEKKGLKEVHSIEEAIKLKETISSRRPLELTGDSIYFLKHIISPELKVLKCISKIADSQLEKIEFPEDNKLKQLIIKNSNLSKLPDLKNLKELEILEISYNKTISDINNITNIKLIKLNAMFCKLKVISIQNFSDFSNLQELRLSHNLLTAIPKNLPKSLKKINISNNQIDSLEPLTELNNLQELNAGSNKITNLAENLPVSLQRLSLDHNKIKSIHPLSQLMNLEKLLLCYNKFIKEVPLSFYNFYLLTEISWTGLDPEVQETLSRIQQTAIFSKFNQIEKVQEQIYNWCKTAYRDPDLAMRDLNIDSLDCSQKTNVGIWLYKLSKTKEYKNNQKQLAFTACEILKKALSDEGFRKAFFPQVESNNVCCEDRSAMSLNEIYTAYILSTIKDAPLYEKVKSLVGCAKTITLRRYLSQRIMEESIKKKCTEEESTEIYLYYEILLREELKLKTAITLMAHEKIGQRSWIKEKDLKQYVNDNYIDTLCDMEEFENILMNDDNYKKEKKEILSSRDCEMEAAYELKTDGEIKTKLEEIGKLINLELKQRKKKYWEKITDPKRPASSTNTSTTKKIKD